jgi:hypothetical protein
MTIPTSRAAYVDCYDALDQAVSNDIGIRIKMPSYDKAVHFRMRCNQARKLDRKLNSEIWAPDDPKFGISQYDIISIRIKHINGYVYLYFEKNDQIPGEVEALSEREEQELSEVDDFEDTPVAPELPPIEKIRRI